MYGLTRGVITLAAAAIAGFLIWLATQINDSSNGGYWAVYGVIAGAGLVMALSQILGGWTKWGWPRLSINVFLIAFLPVLVAAGWVIIARQPDPNWFRNHVTSWSGSIGILGLVRDLAEYVGVLAFGIGLVLGFTFDTSGPAVARGATRQRGRAAPIPAGRAGPPTQDQPTAREERETARAGAERTSTDTASTDTTAVREPARRE